MNPIGTPINKPVAPVTPTVKVSDPSVLEDTPDYKITIEEFGDRSDLKGQKYANLEWKKATSAINHYGEPAVLRMINASLATRLAAQARTGLDPDDKEFKTTLDKRLADGNGLLLTAKDALDYVPGERGEGQGAVLSKMLESIQNVASGKMTMDQLTALAAQAAAALAAKQAKK